MKKMDESIRKVTSSKSRGSFGGIGIGNGSRRRVRPTKESTLRSQSSSSLSATSAHSSSSLYYNGNSNGNNGRSSNTNTTIRRRKKRRRPPPLLIDPTVWKRALLFWITGIILIESYFFYSSIGILDQQLLRGRSSSFNEGPSTGAEGEEKRPPRPKQPPPPKTKLLPKKVITIFGPESSGSTFVSTTLGVAVGAFTEEGGWVHTPAWAFSHVVKNEQDANGVGDRVESGRSRIRRQYNPTGRWTYEPVINLRATSPDGQVEIQHLSLPWGWMCEQNQASIPIVEALVPEECFRYESDPDLHPHVAEKLWYATKSEREEYREKLADESDGNNNSTSLDGSVDPYAEEKARIAAMCREEVHISSDNILHNNMHNNNDGNSNVKSKQQWTCGANCGTNKYSGLALYPRRFSINITSHIQWYASRGVDIRVVVMMRDGSVASRGKLTGHCHLVEEGRREDEVAVKLVKEAMEAYDVHKNDGKDGNDVERVVPVSYEGLMQLKEVYLRNLYHRLGIHNSTYIPQFKDGNAKYLVDIDASKKREQLQRVHPPELPRLPREQTQQQHEDMSHNNPSQQKQLPPKKPLLPKRVIAIFGTESSGTKFLASTLGVAVGAFPKQGQWSHVPSVLNPAKKEWIFHQHNYRRATSEDGEWEVQHLSLPWGHVCENADKGGRPVENVVEAFVPAECFRYRSDPGLDAELAERVWLAEKDGKSERHGDGSAGKNDTISTYSSPEAVAMDAAMAERCRKEVHISEKSSAHWTCGAQCGEGQYGGYALYPKRFFVNITSHIEWYASRGVDVTAIISVRDRTISNMGKLRDHCYLPEVAVAENELAVSLMKEALRKYGEQKSNEGWPKVVAVSYEGLMQYRESYLYNLYRQLGITSSYMPVFEDGNGKYVRGVDEYLSSLPKPKPKPKDFLLPKKIITVVGPESSGTTFLASTFGVAVGAISDGKTIDRQAQSPDGEWEIQHLSLPWGWICEENQDINIVEALVPEECFRYSRDPSLESRLAAQTFQTQGRTVRKGWQHFHKQVTTEDEKLLSRCRDEAKISDEDSSRTCGAKCGAKEYNGFALYPQRFFVNITSHIEWYLSRGVDIHVVLSMRDRTISSRGKLKGHCHLLNEGEKEDEVALSLMSEAIEKYGRRGSSRGSLKVDVSGRERVTIARERVTIASYEGLMKMRKAYLVGLYKELGINSSYVPSFNDGNVKYTVNADTSNLALEALEKERQQKKIKLDSRPLKSLEYHPPPPKESLLPKKLITVIGEGSSFLATTLAVAADAFPSAGRWTSRDGSSFDEGNTESRKSQHELVFEDSVVSTADSRDGTWMIQNLHLPQGSKCNETEKLALVEALVPEECRSHIDSRLAKPVDPTIAARCRNEVHITEDSTSWRCGAKCGRGQYSGYALYPSRFFVNLTSHIEWYLSRGVDVTVVLSLRDRSISMNEKLKNDCPLRDRAKKEEEVALSVIEAAHQKYGKHGSLMNDGEKERVIAVSYEGLMEMREVYMYDLYHQLEINSTYAPAFIDENTKYVADPVLETSLGKSFKEHTTNQNAEPLHFLPW